MGWFFHQFLAFQVDDRVYVFQFLPFGLSLAPWAFHRVIKPVMAQLHRDFFRIHSYLDDFLHLHPSREGLLESTDRVLAFFDSLSIQINLKKSCLVPSRKVVYLGVLLDLGNLRLRIPPLMVEKVLKVCGEIADVDFVSRRRLESLMGLLNFVAPLVPLGRLHLLPIIVWVNRHSSVARRDLPVSLDQVFKDMLRIWQSQVFLSLPVPMSVPLPQLDLMTDASLWGWSGVVLPH